MLTEAKGFNRPVDTQGPTEANPVRRHQSDAYGNPDRYHDGRHNDPRSMAYPFIFPHC